MGKRRKNIEPSMDAMRALIRPSPRYLPEGSGFLPLAALRGAAEELKYVGNHMQRMDGIYTAGSIAQTVKRLASEYRKDAQKASEGDQRMQLEGAATAFEELADDIANMRGRHCLLSIGTALCMRSRSYQRLAQQVSSQSNGGTVPA